MLKFIMECKSWFNECLNWIETNVQPIIFITPVSATKLSTWIIHYKLAHLIMAVDKE
jgi:hypothetical protein